MGPEDLHALAEDLLAACVDALNTIPTFAPGLGGAPERSYVSPGLPAFDCCEMLAVHASVIDDAPTSPGGMGAGTKHRLNGMITHVSLVVHATRCVPTPDDSGEPPSAAELQASAQQINADGWALWNHLFNLLRAEQLLTLCQGAFPSMRAVTPSGGCGGWVFTLIAELPGYNETLGT